MKFLLLMITMAFDNLAALVVIWLCWLPLMIGSGFEWQSWPMKVILIAIFLCSGVQVLSTASQYAPVIRRRLNDDS